jgi:hypothetical protein
MLHLPAERDAPATVLFWYGFSGSNTTVEIVTTFGQPE